MPSQPMGDRKSSQLWDEICTLSRLPDVGDNSLQHKDVDLKKEIWLKSLPSCVRALLHNTDDSSMTDLPTLADEIMMSQNATHCSIVLFNCNNTLKYTEMTSCLFGKFSSIPSAHNFVLL